MYTFLLSAHIFIAVMLVFSVLIQSGKGSSLSNIFGGGGMETVFGAETSAVLNKITSILAVVFIVSSIVLATIPGKLTTRSILQEEIKREQGVVIPPVLPEIPVDIED